MDVYVFLAVNEYVNEAWSVILLQLISVNSPNPGLGIAHAHRHAWVNTTPTLLCMPLAYSLYFSKIQTLFHMCITYANIILFKCFISI